MVEDVENDEFGSGILHEPAVSSARERSQTKRGQTKSPQTKRFARRRPVEESDDDFGSGIHDDYEEGSDLHGELNDQHFDEHHDYDDHDEHDFESHLSDEGDDFGCGLETPARPEPTGQRRRRPPRQRYAAAPDVAPGRSQSGRSASNRPQSDAASDAPRTRSRESADEPVVEKRYEDIPTWEHAISLLVKKQGRSSGSRRSGNGGSRGDSKKRGGGGGGGGGGRRQPRT